MKREDAHALLDGARAGDEVTTLQIMQALAATGDIGSSADMTRLLHVVGAAELATVCANRRAWDGIAA